MNGFLESDGGALGLFGEDAAERPWKEAKAEGVREVASAGGGRPVILATRVRIQRRRVKMPRMEPRVLRRLENCSATEIIAARHSACGLTGGRGMMRWHALTEET